MPLVHVNHRTTYRYPREIIVDPQVIRLRPAINSRTPVTDYSLAIRPHDHYLNWQLDPLGNALARIVIPEKTAELDVHVRFVAELEPTNPFDFFLENEATVFPFEYHASLRRELSPYFSHVDLSPLTTDFVNQVDMTKRSTIDFIRRLNEKIHTAIRYRKRLEPGVQSCDQTLMLRAGSCRDMSWLLVRILRSVGLATRFVSGYLIQLISPPDVSEDSVELHAWVEVYLPGAGWIGLDPTSGLFAAESHIPLAWATTPQRATPISGRHEPCNTEFAVELAVERTPRNQPKIEMDA